MLHREVPLWASILSLILTTAAAIGVFFYFHEVIYNYNYQFNLPTANGGTVVYDYGSWPALQNVDFYNKVLQSLIVQKVAFINANLSTMKLQYYKNGAIVTEVPILTKGRPGSWWETPAGLYKVVAKVENNYSSFAHVHSPWALAFQGNFLIHGWPYYPDGTPVSSAYSGGCIRLSTEDAKALYAMVDAGTPVLVSSADFDTDNFHEVVQGPPIAPKSFLAADMKSNFVFAQKNPDIQLPIASLTKLMTALVAVEYVNIENMIAITPDMIVKTSIPRLKVGEKYSLHDLLHPLLKESSNEAAVAISRFPGVKDFVGLMNRTAKSIGMNDTHFTDTSGSDWGNVSTARDFFVLARHLYNNRSFILEMTTNSTSTGAYGAGAFTNLKNFNVFVSDSNFIGGKVGTNGIASDTIISVFREPFFAGNMASGTIPASSPTERPIMFVILGSDDYTRDAENLYAWIKDVYQ